MYRKHTVGICAAALVVGCGGEVRSSGIPSNVVITLSSAGTRQWVDAWIRSWMFPAVSIDRRVEVPASGLATAFEGHLQSGNYDINVHPVPGDNSACFGEANFDVVQDRSLTVGVAIRCPPQLTTPPQSRPGAVTPVYACPFLLGVTAEPSRAPVGGTIHLTARLSDLDSLVEWSDDSSHTFFDPPAATLDYTCTEAGTHTISVKILKTGTACSETSSTTVLCDPYPRDGGD
jgi:hypothetical protein